MDLHCMVYHICYHLLCPLACVKNNNHVINMRTESNLVPGT
jgi:hypothetical protein